MMFIYNITIKVDSAIEEAWLRWQERESIPEIMSTGLFNDYKTFQLLEQDDSEGATYVIQYITNNKENYDRYINEFAASHADTALKKWGDRFIAFKTLLKVMH